MEVSMPVCVSVRLAVVLRNHLHVFRPNLVLGVSH